MPAAELPQGEENRLSALRALEILDTPAEDRFDLFTRLAADIAGTPIAAISLIDEDRQWFKSRIGLPIAETPREHSFCAHAILAPQQTLVVPDAAADARFADNPLVTGSLGIRFYAGVPLLHPEGHPLGALCVLDRSPRELTPRQRAQLEDLAHGVSATLELYRALRALGELAATDPLTGCANRGALTAALKRLQGQADLPFALFCLDLDRFKAINDLLGHAAGDAALTEVARRLRAVTRYMDVVARPGGDEFVIAAPGLRRAEEADLVADRILAAMAEPFAFEGQPVPLRISIGIALVPQDSADPEEALRRADAALYQAKRASGSRVAHAATLLANARPDSSGAARPGRTALLDALRTALADPATVPFTLDWQPIFQAARPDQVRCAEALIRWPRRAGAQALLPGDFLPVAERHGLMPTLDRWVLGRACREAASWPTTTPIAVNLAAASFLTLDLVDTVERALADSGLPASRLHLEVTESALIGDITRARTMLEALRRLGIKIALDDFGTGHASLAYLRDLPFDTIKIDRSFVIPIETDRRSQKLVRAILQFARSLGLLTVAEGVETLRQFEFLQAEGVDAVQGYLFARPGPAAAFLPATPTLLPVAV